MKTTKTQKLYTFPTATSFVSRFGAHRFQGSRYLALPSRGLVGGHHLANRWPVLSVVDPDLAHLEPFSVEGTDGRLDLVGRGLRRDGVDAEGWWLGSK